jgi:hypothetical protein
MSSSGREGKLADRRKADLELREAGVPRASSFWNEVIFRSRPKSDVQNGDWSVAVEGSAVGRALTRPAFSEADIQIEVVKAGIAFDLRRFAASGDEFLETGVGSIGVLTVDLPADAEACGIRTLSIRD